MTHEHAAPSERPELAATLDLAPHPEGGWFRETWRSGVEFEPPGYGSPRPSATAIYYLLVPGERSRWHRVRSAELWLWHSGGPLELRLGGAGPRPAQEVDVVLLGPDVDRGERPQAIVPARTWQTAEPLGAEPVLVTCIVSPGFDYADFEMPQ
ncbi:cupin domain-containing protein [Jiangella alkaliphila]|uniref:DUF985 domain-containing protein n=1 Tax=Jiangella alkaliphila TaxID=419479 RepID=A0A1H2L2F6_9ACTN|nr:cupin domain-containing protein [Jiangella alkaliphila]SDU74761.1 hypothetical protein SAMN04488563_4810 [Jiangella alkaliphila]